MNIFLKFMRCVQASTDRKAIIRWGVGLLFSLTTLTACQAQNGSSEKNDMRKENKTVSSSVPKIIFERYVDRSEGAFIVLIPQGWLTEGGMIRVNPLTAAGGVGQSIEAKIDFKMKREAAGQVVIHYLPKTNYVEPNAYNAMLGGHWNGMPIISRPSAQQFLTTMLFPQLRPQATHLKVMETTPRADVAAAVRALPAAQALLSQGAQYSVDAVSLLVSYDEGGISYKETLFTAIEGFNLMGTAMWNNTFTIVARSPAEEFAKYHSVAKVIINSFSLNPRWLEAEMKGQIQRSGIVSQTLSDIARIDQEITENRTRTMSQINEQEYLTLTGQEKYLNPHTGKVELGSNEWKYRWQNPSGEIIYTDDEHWDPNIDPDLHVFGYKRSQATRR